MDEALDETVICSYNLEGAPLSYVGELYYEERDAECQVLILKNTLVRVIKTRQGADTSEVGYVRVPMAGRDSTVHIDTRTVKGVLVKNVDPTDLSEYRSAHTRLHSKLHLAP